LPVQESDLYEPVKAWLEARGWDVYAEVQKETLGRRADIVAIQKPCIAIVELKTSLSLSLLEQAAGWIGYAHYVWAATPVRKSTRFPLGLMDRLGVGYLTVRQPSAWERAVARPGEPELSRRVEEKLHPRFNRHVYTAWKRVFRPEHQNGVPGGHAGGGYVTRFRLTMDGVRRYLERIERRDPGAWVGIADVLQHCATHYAVPKPSLVRALTKYKHDWLEFDRQGGKWRFRIKQAYSQEGA
jgi:hypothetical protein